MTADAGTTLRETIAADLREAQRSRDPDRMRVLRVLLGLIDNAGAVDAVAPDHTRPALGSTEVPRRRLDGPELRRRFQAEADEQRDAAEHYRVLGQDDHAARLEQDLRVVRRYLDELP